MEPNYKEAYEALREELNQYRIHYNNLFDVSVNNANLMLQNQELQTTVDDLRLKLRDTQHELHAERSSNTDLAARISYLHVEINYLKEEPTHPGHLRLVKEKNEAEQKLYNIRQMLKED